MNNRLIKVPITFATGNLINFMTLWVHSGLLTFHFNMDVVCFSISNGNPVASDICYIVLTGAGRRILP